MSRAAGSPAVSETLAEGRDVVLAYGGNVAVRPSTFTIPAQAVTAIIGPNGSGKSTLLNALAGVIAPRSGSLTVLGEPPEQAFRKVSYVMQSLAFPAGTPITVREVVAMGRYSTLGWFGRFRKEDRDRVERAMKRLDVSHLAKRHLDELSGGQRQRVYVAQGITQEHEALLLDEPLTGLDLVSAKTIDHIVHGERERGHSVVLTTHDIDEARAADHVVLMAGHVLASGPPAEVLTRANLEAAYGLGSLHDPGDAFVDDPAHAHRDVEEHDHSPRKHPHLD
ncbi:metal ABC transporter ATP-binding protein [Nigerium massiliense]|uniref:metal ABC transporter ATP-binding protein n=1 Tax=Nigerium massiliense TaxID=1522317 RepID=UPI000907952C|nr:metal ABC transporter ATP-binding protein [Nigerium massiliense]